MRAALVDPLVNNLCNRLKAELLAYKEKAEEARADLEAVKFVPDRCGCIYYIIHIYIHIISISYIHSYLARAHGTTF